MPGSKVATPQTPAVLIAVRNDTVRARLKDWLALEFPGSPCVEGVTPGEARRLAAAAVPAVALVDIDMPAAQGLEVLRALRAAAPGTLLIALSADPSDTYRDLAAGAGARLCLPMGMPDSRLECAMRAVLRPARGVEQSPETPKLS